MKRFALVLFCTLFLSSCNLPVQKLTPLPQLVASIVVQTLSAQVQKTVQPSPLLPPSPETPTTTPIVPTATITPSQTVTFTPTTSLDDPKISLGAPAWKDTLVKGTAFFKDKPWLYEDDYNRISVENGKLTLASIGAVGGFRGWRLVPLTPKNFYLEAAFISRSCAGSDLYGLVFRAPDYINGYGYYFGITCDGHYSLSKWDGSGTASLVNPSTNNVLLPGVNQTNHIGILVNNDSIRLYANNKFLQEIKDTSLPDGGHFGPFLAAQIAGFSVDMQEITLWNLP